MTAGGFVLPVVFEVLVALAAIVAARRVRHQHKDRRHSETVSNAGVAMIFGGLAVGIPAVTMARSGVGVAQVLNEAAFGLLVLGFVFFAAAKPLSYLEERAAARMQRAAGLPVPARLLPPWAVATIDVAVLMGLVVAVFFGLVLVGTDNGWTFNHLEAVTTPTGLVLLLVGGAVATWHYWWQGRRVRRSAQTQKADNTSYLA